MNTAPTTRRPSSPRRQRHDPESWIALTIACHPDVRRIGEIALLPQLGDGKAVHLSRTEPDFATPGSAWGRPLDDPYLSRSPLRIEPHGASGLRLDPTSTSTPVRVDDANLTAALHISESELTPGVVLELAERLVLVLHRALASPTPGPDSKMVGASLAMEQVRAAVERVADMEVSILLRGESGTGKELVARELHQRSQRADKPFVAVNLGALPASLAAAELFGSVKGAFTGAVESQVGYFRQAQGGTLFLDEVGEAPDEVQAMLLRTLETGDVYPLGSQRAHKADIRLIAATDSDLEARARRGSFKEPLLHRLSAYEIWLPALRERREDIGRLFLHFARQELTALGDTQRFTRFDPQAPTWLPADLASRLVLYAWPGNVRQLRNVVRQLVIDGRGRAQLTAGARVERLLTQAQRGTRAHLDSTASGPTTSTPQKRRPADIGSDELEAALREHRFGLAAAARTLGITRPSLYYLIRRHPTLCTVQDLDDETIRQALEDAGGDVASAAGQLRVSARALRRRLKTLAT